MSDPYCEHRGCDRDELLAENRKLEAENQRLLSALDWLAISGEMLVRSAITGRFYVTGLNYTHHDTPAEAISEAMHIEGEGGE